MGRSGDRRPASGGAPRGCALGRENGLFAGSDSGGEHAAALYGPICAAKLNGADPEACLGHVLSRIAGHSITRIAALLPWNVNLPAPAGGEI